MNQQPKKLLFNKSTLLSLKAELLKKQEEVKGKKHLPQHRVENYKPPAAPRNVAGVDKPTFKETLKEVDTDELEAQKRSKSALEKKTELYNHLSDGGGASQLAGRFLVDFAGKNGASPAAPAAPAASAAPAAASDSDSELMGDFEDDDDEWTDFTDCLGRTRRCLKTDLDSYRKRDKELTRSMQGRTDGDGERDTKVANDVAQYENEIDQEKQQISEKPLLVQKTDAYLQSLRDKWEQKEKELMEQDRDIHYQDLLFDEARAHGVGYYGFSTEEAARRREHAELARARADTQRAQAQAAARRAERDQLVAARVSAARARQRERAGLPPEDPEQKKEDFTSSLLDFLTEKKKEAAEKAKEEERKAREEREKERQKIRETFVREWDVGKDETGGEKKEEFREMTQEEYEEQQRSKRIQEFAPLQSRNKEYAQNSFDNRGHLVGDQELPIVKKSWADVRPSVTPMQLLEDTPSGSRQGLYFSSTTESEINRVSNSSVVATPSKPVPIVNELEVDEEERPKKIPRNNPGAEIEPPPTYEYYGPESKQSRPQARKGAEVREAYEQGLRFLQEMESKKSARKNFDFLSS